MNQFNKEIVSASVSIIIVAFIGSIMGIFARSLAPHMGVWEQVMLRTFAGSVIILLVCAPHIRLKKIGSVSKSELFLTVARAISMYVIAIPLGTYAFSEGQYATTSIIMALPTTALVSILLFKEKAYARELRWVGLAFVGVCLIFYQKGHGEIDFSNMKANVAALLACFAISWAILARKWHTPTLNNFELTFIMMLSASIIQLIIILFRTPASLLEIDYSFSVIAVIVSAGIANILFLLLSNYGFKKTPGILANNLMALQPVFGVIMAVAIYKESLNLWVLSGGGLILISVFALVWEKYNSAAKSKPLQTSKG